MAKAKCKGCGFYENVNKFNGCSSPYHDLKCPKCGTSNVDTSEINAEWKAKGERYGYGDDNFLIMKGDSK